MEKNRLIWACRRGMLELDILLSRFVEEHYDLLSEDEKLRFDVLLECEDQDQRGRHHRERDPEQRAKLGGT